MGDAGLFFDNITFSTLVRQAFNKPEEVDAQRQLQSWLGKMEKYYGYDQVSLLDAQGVVRMSSPVGAPVICSSVAKGASEVLRSGQVKFQDFYRCEQDQQVYLGMLVPILDEHNANRPLCVLFMRINPRSYLYPFLQHWLTPSRTAETLLIRREGDEVVFLNELRFLKDAALALRAPLTNTAMPAVKAVLGQQRIMEGTDYRNVPVIGDMCAVPDSPWFMVTQIDVAEVTAPMRMRLRQVILLVSILLLCAGTSMGLVWRQQRVRFYREQAKAAEALKQSEERFVQTAEQSQPMVWEVDANGLYTFVSGTAERLLGYRVDEIVG